MFATAAYGYAKGDPYNMLTPFDSDGARCGNGSRADYKYLWWPSIVDYLADACVV